jgi:DNA-3-methyladenine glycosylase
MYGDAGYFYIYLVYGMHWMLNVVTEAKDFPAAILIRGVRDVETGKKIVGPGRVTKMLSINKKYTGIEAVPHHDMWFEKRNSLYLMSRKKKIGIKKSARIGIDYAGPIWAKKEYRFELE